MTGSASAERKDNKGSRNPRDAVLLVNGKSRRGREWFEQARSLLVEGGLNLIDARLFRKPDELKSIAAEHIDHGVPLVVGGGGDGTFGTIAHLFTGRESTLGVLPLGTGNALARDLGIPSDLREACDAIVNGKTARIDMGMAGDRAFLNVATIGLSTLIALGLEDSLKRRLGRAVYAFSLFRALSKIEPFHVKLELDQGTFDFDCLQLVIGNGRFHAGPFPVAPDASITGGHLAIYALASTNKRDFLKMALHLYGGRHVDLDFVRSYSVGHGKLTATPPQLMTIDGEPCIHTPVEFKVEPAALKVRVPQDFGE